MLEVAKLCKTYGSIHALAGVDVSVCSGQILALLGPNGAGKTTLASIVAGLRRADSGSVFIDGVDALRDSRRARVCLGYAPQELGIYPNLTVQQNLRCIADLGVGQRGRDDIDGAVHAVGLDELRERRAGTLSGGEQRRLHTAMALVGSPRLLLLDEPTVGVDVATRVHVLEAVRRLAADGVAILYSTHYLREVEDLNADVAIIHHGRIVAEGTIDQLTVGAGPRVIRVVFDGRAPARVPSGVRQVDGQTWMIAAPDPARTIRDYLTHLGAYADRIVNIEVVKPTLESVFLAHTADRAAERNAAEERDRALA